MAWLIAGGVALPAIQRRLGHQSITTTIDRYGHLLPEVDRHLLATLDTALRDASPASYRPPTRSCVRDSSRQSHRRAHSCCGLIACPLADGGYGRS